MGTNENTLTIAGIRHPDYLFDSNQWQLWRDTFNGGEEYLHKYLVYFSDRETYADYTSRKSLTPIPTFAKAAVLDVRNSIFQRLVDVERMGGSDNYHSAVKGEKGGVTGKGQSMNSFMGIDVLTELLVMGRVGIFVDAPATTPLTTAEAVRPPYMYLYRVEDILSWAEEDPEKPGQFKAVLLRDYTMQFEDSYGGVPLPSGTRKERLRLMWKDADGVVYFRLYDAESKNPILVDGHFDLLGTVKLDIPHIPFVMPSIGDSLLKDGASYQKSLLNLLSRAVDYDLRSNTPFLTIQQELQTVGTHLKKPGMAGTAANGGQHAEDQEERIGGGAGRYYDKGTNKPEYVAPPTEPLLASIRLQEKMEDDIRRIINLSVTQKSGSRTESGEAKKMSSQGLEAGLSFIGTVMQQAEQLIATYWSAYEDTKSPKIATIAYPKRYVLKDEQDRLDEAKGLIAIIDSIPCELARKATAKKIVTLLLGSTSTSEEIDAMHKEIDKNGYTSADLLRLTFAVEKGLVSKDTASHSMGYGKDEVEKARKDREEDVMLTVLAQSKAGGEGGQPALAGALKNPASRGVPAADPNPESGKEEKKEPAIE